MDLSCPRCNAPLPDPAEPNKPEVHCPACGLAVVVAYAPPPRSPAGPGGDAAFHIPPGTVLGGFRVDGPLNSGGMACVYRATQLSLSRKVALKVLARSLALDPLFVQRFNRESDILAALNHPNIITIYDKGLDRSCYYFAMEVVEGATLRQLMGKGPIAPPEVFRIVGSICEALQHAHEQGVIHRDMKPTNVLLDARGRVKVADFGIAHLAGVGSAPVTELTLTHVRMGTQYYMAPEQQFDAKSVDGRADIYALGVMLYEMLTGKLPLGSFDPVSRKLPGLDPRVDLAVERALKTDPDQRFGSPAEMADYLREVAAGTAAGAGAKWGGAGSAVAAAPPTPPGAPASPRDAFLRRAAELVAAGRWDDLLAVCDAWAKEAHTPDAAIDALSARARHRALFARGRAHEEAREWAKALEAYGACAATAPPAELKSVEERLEFCRRKRFLDTTRTPRPAGSAAVAPANAGVAAAGSPAAGGAAKPAAPAAGQGGSPERPTPSSVIEPSGAPMAVVPKFHDTATLRASLLVREIPLSAPIAAFAVDRSAPAVAVACAEPQIQVFAVPGGALLKSLPTQRAVRAIAYAQDGKLFGAATEDGFVTVWQTEGWERVARIDAHVGPAVWLGFSPDGSGVVSIGEDGYARCWWLASPKKPQAAVKSHKGVLAAARLSPDGGVLAAAGEDHTVRLWERTTGKAVATLPARKDRVSAIAFAPNSRLLAVGSWDRTALLWDRKEKSVVKELNPFAGGVLAVCFNRDGSRFAAGGWDKTIRLWALDAPLSAHHLAGHQARVNAVAFGEAGRLFSAGEDGTVRIWSPEDRRELEALRGAGKGFVAFEVTAEARFLVARGTEPRVSIFALKGRKSE
ncbi:MAG: serine/threonine protein kinase [Planctomycetes bacterium]|nr:serine/threonine protein kinase [Planctomycetota bacterium]